MNKIRAIPAVYQTIYRSLARTLSHLSLAADTIDCYEARKRVSATTDVPVVSALMYGCSHYQTVFLSKEV
ncbi:MAG: hypothetical protein WCF23_16775 [Candidatus Nitrosopolaris sp.]